MTVPPLATFGYLVTKQGLRHKSPAMARCLFRFPFIGNFPPMFDYRRVINGKFQKLKHHQTQHKFTTNVFLWASVKKGVSCDSRLHSTSKNKRNSKMTWGMLHQHVGIREPQDIECGVSNNSMIIRAVFCYAVL